MGNQPRPLHEWHEDMGDVLWWLWPIEQAPWVGSPLDLGRTVSFDITVQIGVDVYEVQPQRVGDTGGWPWADADDETLARLFWTPLPDGNALDEAIRDHIRSGPDPLKELAASSEGEDVGRIAVEAVAARLNVAQKALLRRLRPRNDWWTYRVERRGVALSTCIALAKRGIVRGDPYRPFEQGDLGHIRLTPLGKAVRTILTTEAQA